MCVRMFIIPRSLQAKKPEIIGGDHQLMICLRAFTATKVVCASPTDYAPFCSTSTKAKGDLEVALKKSIKSFS